MHEQKKHIIYFLMVYACPEHYFEALICWSHGGVSAIEKEEKNAFQVIIDLFDSVIYFQSIDVVVNVGFDYYKKQASGSMVEYLRNRKHILCVSIEL